MIGIDHFSKFAFGLPIQQKNTESVLKFLQDVFTKHGPFKTVLGDRDSVFRSKAFSTFLTNNNCNLHVAQATHAEANGCCERFIKTLGTIQAKVAKSTNWDETLLSSIQCYNGTPHSTTDAVPGEIFFSTPWILQADTAFGVVPPKIPTNKSVLLNSRRAQAASINIANRHHWPHFSIGDRVAIVRRLPNEQKHNADRRFRSRKAGPYQVVAHEGKGHYVLTSNGQDRIPGNAWELIKCQTGTFPQKGGGENKGL
jgi:transposase InsO family protein